MKHKSNRKARSLHIAAVFNQLDDANQEYIEVLTEQLAAIHETAPETRLSTGKEPENVVQQNEDKTKNMTDQTETSLPWEQETIIIKGRNAGADRLIVHFDGETLNILDFLNHSLTAEYAARYEEIMAHYEAKLKTGTLFDHGFPETTFAPKRLDISKIAFDAPPDDKTLIAALLKEYNVCVEYIQERFKEYETVVEKWFKGLIKNNE